MLTSVVLPAPDGAADGAGSSSGADADAVDAEFEEVDEDKKDG